jgi:hypothetical protein
MNCGRWRIRPRWHVRKTRGWWTDRQRYPQGTVYRMAVWRIQVTVMVDCMTAAEREAAMPTFGLMAPRRKPWAGVLK